MQQFYP